MKTGTFDATPFFSPLSVWVREWTEVCKARLTLLVLMTTWAGFYLGARGSVDLVLLFHTMIGTALVAAGASAFNQFLERDSDALMKRTADRPLPSGRLNADEVMLFACVTSIAGMCWLGFAVNLPAATFAALTLVLYVFVYTPMKKTSSLNTLVGAVPGALPPVIGWAAASGGLSAEAWYLFAILFLWQMPHFLAIAWLYREDYARAGFRMLTLDDPDGRITSRQAFAYAVALLPVSLFPAMYLMVRSLFFPGALALGLGYAWLAWGFIAARTR
ncbi:heme o synthase [Geitlerinema calcuttense]|uniref:Protoheme IX farnesyltransferase n=1 Tax=Geitlerinema calcuttense NRMC-F 0142 TaxID=2922238 RepID=A0ABT7M254_9CYAN|nr:MULTISPECIES: heme o synthase [Cyanophyceae]MDL5054360.1 heme o synthase [Oscillatoria laete-virens NRMC-F 0139]MDL5057917.1 heme o synthase [Geitlerinema calcuttense NRMC-F 0142]